MAKQKPDLPNPEELDLEKRVQEMMEPVADDLVPVKKPVKQPKAAPKKAAAKPQAAKKAVSIKILHEETDTDVTEVIEEVNEQLKSKQDNKPLTIKVIEEEPEPSAPPLVPAEPEPVQEKAATTAKTPAPELQEDEIPTAPVPGATESEPELAAAESTNAAEEPIVEEVVPTQEATEEEQPSTPSMLEQALAAETDPDKIELPPEPSDPGLDKAVDQIVAEESDKLLEAEDFEKEIVEEAKEVKTFRERLGAFFGWFWRNRFARFVLLLGLFGGLIAGGLLPQTRYYALNAAGVRASTSLKVIDESSGQPLRNVTVRVNDQSGQTDADGMVSLTGVRLGRNDIVIEKHAFAPLAQPHVFGWGSNRLGEFRIKPVGSQYSFTAVDFLSAKPVGKVEAVSGEASAFSDEKGVIKLTMDKKDDLDFEVTIKGEGYREEKLTLKADTKDPVAVKMVSARKHTFVSKRSGKYDVYKIDIDGKNEQKILAGTGLERDDMVLAPHPTDEIVALVSTRENKRNKDGFLLSTLTLIDLTTNQTTNLGTSERIQIVDWIGSRLVFVVIAEGSSANHPQRHRLMSYDYKDEKKLELAASNYFNDVLVVNGKIYYAPSSMYQQSPDTGLFRVSADGSQKQTVYPKEIWNMFRTEYDKIILSGPQQWFEYHPSDGKEPVKLDGAPSNPVGRVYTDGPDGHKSLWVDVRDGKGVLLYYDVAGKQDSVLRTQSGLKNPVRWLNNKSFIFRIATEDETADFAMSLDGGEAIKIRDVTNTGGIDRWYYY